MGEVQPLRSGLSSWAAIAAPAGTASLTAGPTRFGADPVGHTGLGHGDTLPASRTALQAIPRYTARAMRRSATLIVMLFAMLWQATTLARPGSTLNTLGDLEHAALHWQAVSHHHHDDGSVHLDDSQASAFHILGDQLTVTAALLPSSTQHFPPLAAGRPGMLHDTRVTDPFIGGLLRPPRLHS